MFKDELAAAILRSACSSVRPGKTRAKYFTGSASDRLGSIAASPLGVVMTDN